MNTNHDLVRLSDPPRRDMDVYGDELPLVKGGQGHDTPSVERAGRVAVACIVLSVALVVGLFVWWWA